MEYRFRAKRTGVCLAPWHKLNNDTRYELVEVDQDGTVTVSRYTKVDEAGQPTGGMQPVKLPPGVPADLPEPPKKRSNKVARKPPKPAASVSEADIDDLLAGV